MGVVAPPVRRGASSMRMRRWSAGRAAARTLRTRARRLASGRFQTIGSRPASWGMHGFSANSADTAPKKVLLSNEPSAQPDHGSAGAGSTAQSKQRAAASGDREHSPIALRSENTDDLPFTLCGNTDAYCTTVLTCFDPSFLPEVGEFSFFQPLVRALPSCAQESGAAAQSCATFCFFTPKALVKTNSGVLQPIFLR